jgi:hypothetical protein
MTPDQATEVRAIVQRWRDSTETTYPGHLALYHLAQVLHINRQHQLPATKET